MEKSYLTADGAKKLKQELEYLKSSAREDLAKRLRAAIQMGDLSENADYTAAKEEQGFLEGRIQELESILKDTVIIEHLNPDLEVVGIGNHVTIQENDFPEEKYHLVGSQEANPAKGRISFESPIGTALLGHKVGDTVIVNTPNGQLKFTILAIE